MNRIHEYLLNLIKFIKGSKPVLILFLEIVFGIAISIFSILLFIKIRGEVLEKDLSFLDNQILYFFYKLRSPFLNSVMIFISYFGEQIIIGLGLIITIFLLLQKHKREAFLFVFVSGMAMVIDYILKNITQRARPVP